MAERIEIGRYEIRPEAVSLLPEEIVVKIFQKVWEDPSLLQRAGFVSPNEAGTVANLIRGRTWLTRPDWTHDQWRQVGRIIFAKVRDEVLPQLEVDMSDYIQEVRGTGRESVPFATYALTAIKEEMLRRRREGVKES